MIAAIPARTAAASLWGYLKSMSADQLMAERLDLADFEPVEARDILLAVIDKCLADLDGSA